MNNPYASFLGDSKVRDALALGDSKVRDALAETPHKLTDYVQRLGEEQVNLAPAPGKWSVREIICHLAETEVVFLFRLKQALAEDHHVVQPFDQDRWAANYQLFDAIEALSLFSAARIWNLRMIDNLKAGALEKKLNHPERGELTIRTQIETMAGHDINHLRQIEKLL